MKVFCYTINDPEGVHALPAGGLIKLAATFPCEIIAEGNGKTVDVKNAFGLMSLGVKHGQPLTISCSGPDEEKAAAALERYVKDNL